VLCGGGAGAVCTCLALRGPDRPREGGPLSVKRAAARVPRAAYRAVMALQGSLKECALWEIVQLLSRQKKTGRLLLRNNAEQVPLYFLDGRIAGAREQGLGPADPLIRFLRRRRWLPW